MSSRVRRSAMKRDRVEVGLAAGGTRQEDQGVFAEEVEVALSAAAADALLQRGVGRRRQPGGGSGAEIHRVEGVAQEIRGIHQRRQQPTISVKVGPPATVGARFAGAGQGVARGQIEASHRRQATGQKEHRLAAVGPGKAPQRRRRRQRHARYLAAHLSTQLGIAGPTRVDQRFALGAAEADGREARRGRRRDVVRHAAVVPQGLQSGVVGPSLQSVGWHLRDCAQGATDLGPFASPGADHLHRRAVVGDDGEIVVGPQLRKLLLQPQQHRVAAGGNGVVVIDEDENAIRHRLPGGQRRHRRRR